MAANSAQEQPELSPLERARHLITKVLGVRRVAGWCGVDELTPYKWLERGTDARPIPTEHVPAILNGAKADGLDAPVEILWPAMAGVAS